MRDSASGGALTEVTFYILLALCEPRHGYAVMQFAAERTGGRLELGAGTLYGALGTLEKRGWIRAWRRRREAPRIRNNAGRPRRGEGGAGAAAHSGRNGGGNTRGSELQW